jgi:hypothetical protein
MSKMDRMRLYQPLGRLSAAREAKLRLVDEERQLQVSMI